MGIVNKTSNFGGKRWIYIWLPGRVDYFQNFGVSGPGNLNHTLGCEYLGLKS